jgi:hypothetical protein
MAITPNTEENHMSDYYAQRRAASLAMYPRITDNRAAAATYNLHREGYTVQSLDVGWVLTGGDGDAVEYHDTLGAALAAIRRMNEAGENA